MPKSNTKWKSGSSAGTKSSHWSKKRPKKHTPAKQKQPASTVGWRVVHSGHSFVRGFKQAILRTVIPEASLGPSTGSRFRDVIDLETAILVSNEVGVNEKYQAIFTHSRDIIFIQHLLEAPNVDAIIALGPDSIVFNMGTNDMACFVNGWTEEMVTNLAARLRQVATNFFPIKCIFMGQVPRLQGIQTTAPDFREMVRTFNKELEKYKQEALTGTAPTNFRYHEMRGWDKVDQDGASADLPVTSWCNSQGIHPREHVYRDKYRKSLKRALIMNKNRPQ